MPKIEYHLYRTKFIRPNQDSFLHESLTPAKFFKIALEQSPAYPFTKRYIWRVGNIEFFDDTSGFFAIGRTTKATLEQFDDETHTFRAEPYETSPYTFVVFDLEIGLLGIAKKSKLSPTTAGIARKLVQLMLLTPIVRENEIEVRIGMIPDPADFLSRINDAFRITKFMATFTGPNPIDADELFQKPMSVYINEANGRDGQTLIEGERLNKDVIEAVAKSTAATSNYAEARIQERPTTRLIKIKLDGDPIVKIVDDDKVDKKEILDDLRKQYQKKVKK